jgi:endonuclease/exonuclease/phosphatase (EEP) superfamily protein YafD
VTLTTEDADRSRRRRSRVAAGRILAALVAGVAALVVATSIAPQTTGVVALAQILLPHLVVAVILAAGVLAAVMRTRALAVALVVLVGVTGLRFGSEWVSIPAPAPTGQQIRLTTWNLELGARAAAAVAGPILRHDADVVALQELTPDAASALEADDRITARYPYRFLVPDAGTFGIGILSAFPIVERTAFSAPSGAVVTLDLGAGRHLRLMDAHPLPGRIEMLGQTGFPVGFDPRERDAATARLRSRIDTLWSGGEPLIVVGDFNTAPTEPGYALLTHGLTDLHVEVGFGPGWTWRPSRLEGLGLGLLRIDLILVGPGVVPVSSGVDCSESGDHCLVDGTVAVP